MPFRVLIRNMELTYIYGHHAVREALISRPDVVRIVFLDEKLREDESFKALALRAGSCESLTAKKLPGGIPRDAVHQGAIAAIDTDKLMISWKTFKGTLAPHAGTSLVVMGELEDPHNVGAIIRSAAAFGAAAVLIPEHRQAPLTGTVIKVSAGAAFVMPVVSVGNVNTALLELKELGFWVYGLAGDGDASLVREKFDRPSVFVVGNEGRGMREKTREHCDTILTIPIHKRMESLNASVSAAVVLYAWSAQHGDAVRSENI